MFEFLTSVEGIACIFVSLLGIAGGINEFIYFNRMCNRTIKGYEDLRKDMNDVLS